MNYVGYHGFVRSCEWSIMTPDVHTALGKPVPAAPTFRNVARKVPGMETSTIPIHGLTTDLARTKARITDKYVQEDRFLIEVTFWNVDIEDRIWLTGAAKIELPSICVRRKQNSTQAEYGCALAKGLAMIFPSADQTLQRTY